MFVDRVTKKRTVIDHITSWGTSRPLTKTTHYPNRSCQVLALETPVFGASLQTHRHLYIFFSFLPPKLRPHSLTPSPRRPRIPRGPRAALPLLPNHAKRYCTGTPSDDHLETHARTRGARPHACPKQPPTNLTKNKKEKKKKQEQNLQQKHDGTETEQQITLASTRTEPSRTHKRNESRPQSSRPFAAAAAKCRRSALRLWQAGVGRSITAAGAPFAHCAAAVGPSRALVCRRHRTPSPNGIVRASVTTTTAARRRSRCASEEGGGRGRGHPADEQRAVSFFSGFCVSRRTLA